MTILEILTRAGVAGGSLLKLLEQAAERVPELAPDIEIWIEELKSAIDPAHLIELSYEVIKEVHDIARGKLDPHDHPSDSI